MLVYRARPLSRFAITGSNRRERPTEPNGEVHYVIYYTPEGGTEQSIDTGSNLTHYNLTGLESNRVYTNITVQAVNSVGRSIRSAVIVHYNNTSNGGY